MRVLFLSAFLMTFYSCAGHRSADFKIRAEEPLQISTESHGKVELVSVDPGETYSVPEGITTIRAEHRVPLVIVTEEAKLAQRSEGAEWAVSLKKVEEWRPEDTESFISKEMDQLSFDLIDVLLKARSKNISESLRLTEAISKRYPKLSSIHFVKAQLEVMDQKYDEAIKSLEVCLQLNPQFLEAKNLKDKILVRRQQ